ncbi:MAG TPA: SMC-Scp complex subunit ScpB [Dermatophilaceae bacterium]|nr:SMC-Scp complex subunit ScpB [Dermatophilaceae bacterium]
MTEHDQLGATALDIDAFPGGVRSALEAVLMVVEEPVPTVALATALEVTVGTVEAHLHELEAEYAAQHRGFTLRELAGGWRFYSRTEYGSIVERFVIDGAQARLTQAALETLAVVAYLQPVSRARIGSVRGVNVESVLRTLVTRGLVEELDDRGEGGAILYGTTGYFLERLGLRSLDELPPIAHHLPDADLLDQLAEEGRG